METLKGKVDQLSKAGFRAELLSSTDLLEGYLLVIDNLNSFKLNHGLMETGNLILVPGGKPMIGHFQMFSLLQPMREKD
ncbi:hypothetical protein Tco_1120665 [Tanacetum coccineum]